MNPTLSKLAGRLAVRAWAQHISLLGCLLIFSSNAHAQAPAPQSNLGYRYLFLVDASFSMHSYWTTVRYTVQDAIASGFNGQIQNGEGFGIWTFNHEVHTAGFPMLQWVPDLNLAMANSAAQFLKTQPTEHDTRLDKALQDATILARKSELLTVILISDEESIQGTPFDAAVNAAYREHKKEVHRRRQPFITTLLAVNGKFVAWTVGDGSGKIALPSPPDAASSSPVVAVPVMPEVKEIAPKPVVVKEEPIAVPQPPTVAEPKPAPPLEPTVIIVPAVKPSEATPPPPVVIEPTPATKPPPATIEQPTVKTPEPTPEPPKPTVVEPVKTVPVPKEEPHVDPPPNIPVLPAVSIPVPVTEPPAQPTVVTPVPEPAPRIEIPAPTPTVAKTVPEPVPPKTTPSLAPKPAPPVTTQTKPLSKSIATLPVAETTLKPAKYLILGLSLLLVAGGLIYFSRARPQTSAKRSLISHSMDQDSK